MKKYHAIIKLVVIITVLVGLGVVAFKYLHNVNNDNVEIQTMSQRRKQPLKSTQNNNSSKTTTQGNSSRSKNGGGQGSTCSNKSDCNTGYSCCLGSCQDMLRCTS